MSEPGAGRTGATTASVSASVRVDAPREAVFDFLVDPEKLMRWMGTGVEIDPRPGGGFLVNVTGADVASGAYIEVRRPERVAFTWGWEGSVDVAPGSSLVTIDLRADGDATIVELTHSGLPAGAGDDHLRGWEHYLARLGVAAPGGDPGPDPMAADPGTVG